MKKNIQREKFLSLKAIIYAKFNLKATLIYSKDDQNDNKNMSEL